TLPGMLVVNPCDGYEMTETVEALLNYEGPAYLRMCRFAMDIVTETAPGYKFELGKGVTLRDGSDVTIIANGLPVGLSVKAADLLAAEGISARVIDLHTLKPLDEELILKAAAETGAILTVEEHNVIGGLGSAVCECVSEHCPVPVLRHGIPDVFGRSGTAAAVLAYYGLTPETIAEKAKAVMQKKK
ncbi:MAG: transketolase family protein, partial [bacterium]